MKCSSLRRSYISYFEDNSRALRSGILWHTGLSNAELLWTLCMRGHFYWSVVITLFRREGSETNGFEKKTKKKIQNWDIEGKILLNTATIENGLSNTPFTFCDTFFSLQSLKKHSEICRNTRCCTLR